MVFFVPDLDHAPEYGGIMQTWTVETIKKLYETYFGKKAEMSEDKEKERREKERAPWDDGTHLIG